ncbi:MAG: endopeptidase La [Lachnospiraceae bacterium]|nr:endopeptidase La [Lachnospiraceae bacterium]
MARAPKKKYAMIVLDGTVILPNMTVQLEFPKESGLVNVVEEAMKKNQFVFVVNRINKDKEVTLENVGRIGTITTVYSIYKNIPGDVVKINVEGISRGELEGIDDSNDLFLAEVRVLKAKIEPPMSFTEGETELSSEDIRIMAENTAIIRILKDTLIKYSKVHPKTMKAVQRLFDSVKSIDNLIDGIAGILPLTNEEKLKVLQSENTRDRLNVLVASMDKEIEVENIKMDLVKNVKSKVEKNQREYVLREQLKLIKKELDKDGGDESEEEIFKNQVEALIATDEVKARILKEIDRYTRISPESSEGAVQRNYIETLLEMPWDKVSKDSENIDKAVKILEKEHYGLDKVKERVLEFLSVRMLTNKGDSPILCLVGPPGTGKTSVAKSIATALNKKYVRISLGGVRDEAEIRGHRRTYVGAMPGRIAMGLKNASVKNPLMLLDEVDKASADYKGDTSAALLEVLDGEQNSKFRDNYIDVPLDLSEVLFIATANDKNAIPRPLLDRMEIIDLSGYTENEKFHIAKEHLVKKQLKANGLKGSQLKITDEALEIIIQHYTKEAGVRGLERNIGKLCRKAARMIVQDGRKSVTVSVKNIKDFLGNEKFHFDKANEKDEVGIVRGLAWTQVGGDTLQIEVNIMPGKGDVILTGQLGDVMKESAQIGISYLRSIAKSQKISADTFKKNDFHIHIPQGSVPKDGPSAGITMATAVYSAITNKKVRADVAMTGEITLRGRVLPIGGLKEKLLAAKTAGIKTVLVPVKNEPDVSEIDEEIKDGLEIVFVETMDQVLRRAIV